MLEAVERFRPDLLVRESQEYSAVLASELAGVPHARVAITNGAVDVEAYTHAASALDEHRSAHRILKDRPLDPSGARLMSEPALSFFPPSLEDGDAARFPVQRFRASAKAPAAPLPAYWGDDQRPLVYATFGTVAGGMELMQSAYRLLLEALAPMPVRVLLTIGHELPIEQLGSVPDNVHVERFVPQDDVFPQAVAVVGHGGSGTTLGVLAAGLPMLVVPLFADQPHNARAIEAAGAGLQIPGQDATPEALRAALTRVMSEAAFRSAAQRLAAEMAALPSVDDAPLALEKLAR